MNLLNLSFMCVNIITMKKKLFLTAILLSIFTLSTFAQTKVSQKAQDYIDSFMKLRMDLTVYQNDKPTASKKLSAYKSSHPYSDLSEQEKLIVESFYLLEDYNWTWEDSSNDARLQRLLQAQINKNEDYIAKNEGKISGWLYVITADTFSCYMSYNPVSGAMKYGMKLKKYYEKCLELDPSNSYCLTHIAQWYYWAPGINGGSTKKAQSYFTSGLTNAKNSAEKFYAEIFLSQILYENKDKAGAQTHLNKAKTYCPDSQYTKEIEQYNKEGYSLFTYSKKKAENENRVNQ